MRYIALVFLPLLTVVAGPAHAQDAAAGEKVFAKCKACHVADTEQNKIGPSLQGVIGAGEKGLGWSDEALAEFLQKPKEVVQKTKMAFPGLKSDEDVANIIAYVKQFSE
jgi:cytochrome c